MDTRKRRIALGALATLAAGVGVDFAAARQPRAARTTASSALRFVGHDGPDVLRSVRRYTGIVTALGAPDADGRIYSFQAAPIGPGMTRPETDGLRGWRLTVLAGSRFSSVFEVRSNTDAELTVALLDGPVNGLAVSDVFVVEEIAIERTPPEAQGPPGPRT